MTITKSLQSDIVVLGLSGRFDTYQVPVVKQSLEEAVRESSKILVNLSDVNFMDSTALAMLVQGMKRCRQEMGGDLRLCCLQRPVQVIFELTRLDKAFMIFSTEAAAVASFR